MEKGKKAQIKKLVDSLHENKQGGQGPKGQTQDRSPGAKGFKGAKKGGTYRPKI